MEESTYGMMMMMMMIASNEITPNTNVFRSDEVRL
jgi:hypothetical protein